jgi:hypothetical protein
MVKADIKILHHTFNEEIYKFQFPVVRVKWSSYLCLKELLFKGYHASFSCKITIALAVVEKFRIKGFIPVETLIANNKISRKRRLL